ncbi:helix-turn-helix transcriptional regulator [Paraburkholderia saeva]|uniref:helix-turn-helix transcriptional regulator n=1 Tax=Paraburkholderia saeva TaxID=2777537 RepID=UPI00389B3722
MMLNDKPPLDISTLPGEMMLRTADVVRIIPVSKSTISRMVKENRFPQPWRVSNRLMLWRVDDIREFIRKQFPPATR